VQDHEVSPTAGALPQETAPNISISNYIPGFVGLLSEAVLKR
jgi:hypothetical protein